MTRARMVADVEALMSNKERSNKEWFPRWIHVLSPAATTNPRSNNRHDLRDLKASLEEIKHLIRGLSEV